MQITLRRQQALKALIDRRFGGVQSRFGTAIGRQSDYVSRLVNGKKALGEKLAREIERILGLPAGELDREPGAPDHVEPLGNPLSLAGHVPVFSWDYLAAIQQGQPTTVTSIEVAPRPTGVGEGAYALKVRGPAMEPEFRDGWLVYIDPHANVNHGDFIVAQPAGRMIPLLRQLVIEGDRRYLQATNPAQPEPLIELGDGRVFGRVVYQARAY